MLRNLSLKQQAQDGATSSILGQKAIHVMLEEFMFTSVHKTKPRNFPAVTFVSTVAERFTIQ